MSRVRSRFKRLHTATCFAVDFVCSWSHYLFWVSIVSLLPNNLKRRSPYNEYDVQWMHVLSGFMLAILSLITMVRLCIYSLVGFSGKVADVFSTEVTEPISGTALLWGGSIGFFTFLINPLTWLCFLGFLEGVCRILEPPLVNYRRGFSLVCLCIAIMGFLRRKWKLLEHKLILDRVYPEVVSELDEMAEIRIKTLDDKRWKTHQLVRYKGRFFILESVESNLESGREVYRYFLRKADWWEIREGAVEYSPA